MVAGILLTLASTTTDPPAMSTSASEITFLPNYSISAQNHYQTHQQIFEHANAFCAVPLSAFPSHPSCSRPAVWHRTQDWL